MSKAQTISGLLSIDLRQVQILLGEIPDPAVVNTKGNRPSLMDWNNASMEEIKAAKTLKEAEKAFRNAPDESEVQKTAFDKWLGMCDTPEKALEMLNVIPPDCKFGRLVMTKIDGLCLEQVAQATDINGIVAAARNAFSNSKAQKLAVQKLAAILPAE